MAQQFINIGTSANKGDGEPLRTAFDKINDNFTEVYTDISALKSGAIVADVKGTIVGDDSTILVDGVNSSINLAGTVKGDIIPDTNVAYDIGSATKRFKDLYLSGNTINLGGTALSITAGKLQVGGTDVGSTISFSELTNKPTTVAGYGITDAASVGSVNGLLKADGAGNISQAVAGVDYITAETSHADVVVDGDFTSSGFMKTDGAGNYSVDSATYLSAVSLGQVTGVDINDPQDDQVLSYNAGTGDWVNANLNWGNLTGTPTTLSGYGITDAQSTLVSGTTIKTVNGTSLLGSGDIVIAGGGGADLSAVNQNYTPDTDNAYDLGIAAGNFLRTGYFKTSVVIGTGIYSNATLTYNADGELQSSQTINTYGLTSSSYMTISAGFGGLIFWQERGGNIGGLSGMNGNNEMVWYGSNYSANGPTYQLDNDQANLQIGGEVTKTISGVTLGPLTSLNTSDSYYFNPNSTITITGVVGTTELNNQTYFIDSSNTLYTDAALTTPLDSSLFTPYVSGGTAVVAPRATMSLPVLHSAPTTPKSGMMAVADGTNWNPTSTGTETMVVYLGGAWRTIANA